MNLIEEAAITQLSSDAVSVEPDQKRFGWGFGGAGFEEFADGSERSEPVRARASGEFPGVRNSSCEGRGTIQR